MKSIFAMVAIQNNIVTQNVVSNYYALFGTFLEEQGYLTVFVNLTHAMLFALQRHKIT